MKPGFTLVLAAAFGLLVGCQAQDGSNSVVETNPTAPSASAASPIRRMAQAVETISNEMNEDGPPAANSAPEKTTETTPNNNPIPDLVGPEPVAGVDYEIIENGQVFQVVEGKVEVAEVFGYLCPACARSQLYMTPWIERLPADVNFVHVPILFGGSWDNFAHAFLAAQALGVAQVSHQAMYSAIHVEKTLKGERGRDSVDDIAAFYSRYGIEPQTFIETMNSFAVITNANRAKQFAQRNRVTSTPSIVVGGKYRVNGTSFEDRLRITDHLIARERAARD